jgi:hypothetical protein
MIAPKENSERMYAALTARGNTRVVLIHDRQRAQDSTAQADSVILRFRHPQAIDVLIMHRSL